MAQRQLFCQEFIVFLQQQDLNKLMNNRIRRQTSPPQEEHPSSSSSVVSPNKFQRTAKRPIRTPEETNVTSEISEPLSNQPIKPQTSEKDRVISRTNRATREITRSPAIEEPQVSKLLQRTNAPTESPKGNLKISFNQSKKIETEPSQKSLPISEKKIEQHAVTLQKSSVSCVIISRLLMRVLASTFCKLKQHRVLNRLKLTAVAKCLLLSVCDFSKRYELKLYGLCLEKVKMISEKQMKEQFQGFGERFKMNCNKSKQYILKLSETLLLSKVRQAFNKLKSYNNKKDNVAKALSILLNGYQRKMVKKIFINLKQKSQQGYGRRRYLMNIIVNWYSQFSKEQLLSGFSKIFLISAGKVNKVEEKLIPLKSPRGINVKTGTQMFAATNQIQVSELAKKLEKLTNDYDKISSQVQQKESQIQSKKKESAIELQKLKKSVEELKGTKKKIEKELADKKSTHQNIKRTLQATGTKPLTSQDLQNEGTDTSQLAILQNIYSQVYKVNEDDINVNLLSLMRQHRVDINSQNHIIEQWSLIRQKSDLQRQIDLYETSILGGSSSNNDQNSILKLVRQQNQMVRNLIRNFIKERYLWGEVQKFVAAVL